MCVDDGSVPRVGASGMIDLTVSSRCIVISVLVKTTIISLVLLFGHRMASNWDNYAEGECIPERNNGTGGTEND